MEIEKKIGIGDLVAIIMAMVAISSVFLQAKSTSISEKQLQIQVDDISKVVDNLERQQENLLDEQIGRLEQGEKLYNSQSAMHQQLLEIGRLDRQISDMYIRSLTLSQSVTLLALSTLKFNQEISGLLENGLNINRKLMSMLMFTSEWQHELKKISAVYENQIQGIKTIHPVTKEIPERLAKLNDSMAHEIALINGRYSEKLKPIKSGFIEAQVNLLKEFDAISKLHPLIDANKAIKGTQNPGGSSESIAPLQDHR